MGYEMVDKLVPMEDIFLESMYENEIRKTKDILELAAGNLNSDDRRLYKMMYSVGENVVHINENNKKKLENKKNVNYDPDEIVTGFVFGNNVYLKRRFRKGEDFENILDMINEMDDLIFNIKLESSNRRIY